MQLYHLFSLVARAFKFIEVQILCFRYDEWQVLRESLLRRRFDLPKDAISFQDYSIDNIVEFSFVDHILFFLEFILGDLHVDENGFQKP